MRYELTDEERAAIKPTLTNKPRGIPRANDRLSLVASFRVLRSGDAMGDLPDTFGQSTTCYSRFVRWRRAGAWATIMNALAGAHDVAALINLPLSPAPGNPRQPRRWKADRRRPACR